MMRNPGGEQGMDFQMPNFNWGNWEQKSTRYLLGGVVLLWLLSGVYTVGPDEAGVVQRFGKLDRSESPGINYHLPFPFETVETPKVTQIKRVEIGFRTIDPGPPARYRHVAREARMLTGDENIVDLNVIVQYRIRDAEKYLFNVRDPEETAHDVAEASIRNVIGKHKIEEALTDGKFEIQEETKVRLQEVFDRYELGLVVVAVQLQDVQPPEEVIDAFKDVASAREDKNKLINQAQGYQNDIIPRARGEAQQTIRESEAYKEQRIKTSQGDAERFLQVLQEYRKAKSVTERRLYLETMEEVLPRVRKYIVDAGNRGQILNLLNLDRRDAVEVK